jgi:O-antigen/teichoic acid export membrane protein
VKAPDLEVAIKVTAVPPGWRSTEFWIVVAILAMASPHLGSYPWSLLAAAVASVGYSLSRAKVKSLPWEALNSLGQKKAPDEAEAGGGVR